MPGFDGTGPRGMGPMTGGGRGFCNPYGPAYGMGFGYRPTFGWPRRGGRGGGFGRGMWAGRGMGYPYAYGVRAPYASYPYMYGGGLPSTPYGAVPYAPYYARYPYGW